MAEVMLKAVNLHIEYVGITVTAGRFESGSGGKKQ